jgi:hypothetical protein
MIANSTKFLFIPSPPAHNSFNKNSQHARLLLLKYPKLFAYILKKEYTFVKSNRICETTTVKSGCQVPKALKNNIFRFFLLSTDRIDAGTLHCSFAPYIVLTVYQLSTSDATSVSGTKTPPILKAVLHENS